MHIGIAAKMSIMECCLRNTVEILIRAAVTVKAIFQPTAWNRLQFHAVNITATEPITCSDGQTFVLVSNS